MVTRYGMSEALGMVSLNYEDMPHQLSSETRAQVEQEVGDEGRIAIYMYVYMYIYTQALLLWGWLAGILLSGF